MSVEVDIARLREMPLFGGLGDEGLEIFARLANPIRLSRGEDVFREGDPARAIFVLAEGQVAVLKRSDDEERQLTELSPGDFFGEMSFLDMQPRAGTVRVTSGQALVWQWSFVAIRDVYRADLKSYTLLVMNIAREVSRRLRRADEMLVQSG